MTDLRETTHGEGPILRIPGERNGRMTDRRNRTGIPATRKDPATKDRPKMKRITIPGKDSPARLPNRRMTTRVEDPILLILNEKNGRMTNRHTRKELRVTIKNRAAADLPGRMRITIPGNDTRARIRGRRETTPGAGRILRILNEKSGRMTSRHTHPGLQDRRDSRAAVPGMIPDRALRADPRTGPPGRNPALVEYTTRPTPRGQRHEAAPVTGTGTAGRRETDGRAYAAFTFRPPAGPLPRVAPRYDMSCFHLPTGASGGRAQACCSLRTGAPGRPSAAAPRNGR